MLQRTSLAANSGVGPQISLKFEYDWKGRRTHKQVWANTTWNGSPTNDVKFLYDGWNVVSILNSPSSILASFLWGTDLSGTMQGAGGVGGLLAVSYRGGQTTNCFVAFDGNGNVAALVNAADGTSAAQYEYGPFGELIRATGPMAKANPLRFSTKYQDDETDLLYYGYRHYNASTGRWICRDPVREVGSQLFVHTMWDKPEQPLANVPIAVASKSLNRGRSRFYSIGADGRPIPKLPAQPSSEFIEYQFCHNQPVNRIDADGRADIPGCGVWAVPVGIGLLLALSDQIPLARECNYLAEHQDQESYGRTLNTKIVTAGLSFLVYEHCPQGGSVYLHVWMENCDCKHNYVIVCDTCGA